MPDGAEVRHRKPLSATPHAAIGAAVFGVAVLASLALWTRFGEAVYVERILGAIAGCF